VSVERAAPRGAVFLSYAREDRTAVQRVAEALRAAGVEVWFDQSELVGGDAWDAKIRGQIKSCALFVPVISAATQARREGYFRIEWKLAAQRTHAIADGTPFLLPVVIDATGEGEALVPEEFRVMQWTRLRPALRDYGGPARPDVRAPDGQALDEASVAAFCARVRMLLGEEPVPASSRPTLPAGRAHPERSEGMPALRQRRFPEVAWVVLAAAVLAVGGWWLSRKPAAGESAKKRIAVLPFVTASGDKDEETISDGIADEVLTQLGRAPGLLVSGRLSSFSFKGQKLTDAEIAQKLGVEFLVTGSFQKSGSVVRVRPSLVNATNGAILWGETFTKELTNVFALQDEIAGLIAQKLEVSLGATARAARTVNPVAYGLAQKGRFLWLQRTAEALAESQSAFEESIRIDPGYAEAHAGLADTCLVRGWYLGLEAGLNQAKPFFVRARGAAQEAVRLDANLAQPHAALGALNLNEDRIEESEREFQTALRLNPNYSYAHHWHAHLLGMQGRIDEAIVEMERATQIDPFSLSTLVLHAIFLAHAGRHAEALAINDRALPLQSEFLPTRGHRALSLLLVGRRDEALREARFVAKDVTARPRWWLDGYALLVLRQLGQEEEAKAHAERLIASSEADSYYRVYAAAALGRVDEALDALRRTPVVSTAQVMVFCSEAWAEVRQSPRFAEVMKELGWLGRYETARATVARMKAERAAKK